MFKFNEYNRPALKSAIYFFLFGFIWILLSDNLLLYFVSDTKIALHLQTYKGWLFICLTTLFLYLTVRAQIKIVVTLKNQLQASELRYKKIVELTHDVIWTVNKNGVITFVNQASNQVYGLEAEEMIGKKFSDFIDEETYSKNEKIFQEHLQRGLTSIEYETVITKKDGKLVYLLDHVNALMDEYGQILEIVGSSKDITSDKLYEIELIEANQRLETALLGGNLGLWDYNLESKEVFVDETWKNITGLTDLNKKFDSVYYGSMIHPDDIIKMGEPYLKFINGESETFSAEHRLLHKEKGWRWFQLIGKVAQNDEHQQPRRLIGTLQDITEKKQLELDLNYWLNVYRSFIKFANEGIFLYELEVPVEPTMSGEKQIDIFFNKGHIKTCNSAFAAMYGYQNAEDMQGFRLTQLQGGDDNLHNIGFLNKFISSGYRMNNEISLDIDRYGNLLYISNNLVGIFENDKMVRIWGSQFNITDQVLAQKKLEQSELRYRLLFETNPVPLIIFSLENFRIYDANSAAEKLFECTHEELLKIYLQEIRPDLSDYDLPELQQKLSKELSQTIEITLLIKGKKSIKAEVRTEMIESQDKMTVIAAINDITLLREAEKMVIRSLIEGEDRERKRVAKEIHDSLGQNLTAASLNFSAMKSMVEKMDDVRKEKFMVGYSFLNSAIEESRNIALNLMPKAIDDFGLVPSLKSLFSQIEMSGEVKITFYENLRGGFRLPRNIELNLYRITQEAINNVLKHADANHIFVQLLLHKKEIIYTFEDDGKGFDVRNSTKSFKGMGLMNISNRVMALSGISEIDSVPGKGTAITIQIPL